MVGEVTAVEFELLQEPDDVANAATVRQRAAARVIRAADTCVPEARPLRSRTSPTRLSLRPGSKTVTQANLETATEAATGWLSVMQVWAPRRPDGRVVTAKVSKIERVKEIYHEADALPCQQWEILLNAQIDVLSIEDMSQSEERPPGWREHVRARLSIGRPIGLISTEGC